jgi:hypothetical protein
VSLDLYVCNEILSFLVLKLGFCEICFLYIPVVQPLEVIEGQNSHNLNSSDQISHIQSKYIFGISFLLEKHHVSSERSQIF